ncbi:MAG: zinc-ribbon domain-containing protein [Clostridia bacterium]|jgi:RNA polymerase subunit RPABC4/transcription elongation factor Spt4/uncharacterized membrane protein
MKCKQCGNELEENAKFCPGCGTSTVEVNTGAAAENPAPAGGTSDTGEMKCKKCGAVMGAGVKFCPSCGASSVDESICRNCGAKLEPGVRFCAVCGAVVGAAPFVANPYVKKESAKDTFNKINDTTDTTAEYDPQDIALYKRISVVAYLGPLVLIPLICIPNSKFTRYHSNQGLILAILDVVVSALISVITTLFRNSIFLLILAGIISFAFSVVLIYLTVVGIINAVKGRAKELPVIGKIRLLK